MKQDKLIDALGTIDLSYIDEAAPGQNARRSRLGVWLSLAACLVLAVSLSALLLLRFSPQRATTAAAPAEHADAAPPNTADPTEKADGVTSESPVDGEVARETVLAYRIGALYLGMPKDEVKSLLGEPPDRLQTDVLTADGRIARTTWLYNLSGDPGRVYDLSVGLANAGEGWVVDELRVWADNGLELPHGIRIGMTEEELLAIWPEASKLCVVRKDPLPDSDEKATASYLQYGGSYLRLEVRLTDEVVDYVALGNYYLDIDEDAEAAASTAVYSFSGSEILVWRRDESGWHRTELAGQDAKRVEVQFSIEDLQDVTCATGVPRILVDFGNGTVAALFGDGENGAVYRLDDREAFDWALQNGSSDPDMFGMTRLCVCAFPEGVRALLEELTGA